MTDKFLRRRPENRRNATVEGANRRARLCGSVPAASLECMSYSLRIQLLMLSPLLAVAACHSASKNVPGDAADHSPWNEITAKETVRFLGTEPFWNGAVGPQGLTYATPGNEKGETVRATRFAGRGGVSFSGTLSGEAATLAVTPGECSDGMSDARYPFTVTLQIGDRTLKGCGWTDRLPRSGAGG